MEKLKDKIEEVLPDEIILNHIKALLYFVNETIHNEIKVGSLDKRRNKNIKDVTVIIERLIRLKKMVLGLQDNEVDINLVNELKNYKK